MKALVDAVVRVIFLLTPSIYTVLQAIDGRVSMYQNLLKVYGRLGLITAHARHAKDGADGDDDGDARPVPEVMYEDGSDEEVEDAFAPGEVSDSMDGSEDGDMDDDMDEDDEDDGFDDEDDEDDFEDDE